MTYNREDELLLKDLENELGSHAKDVSSDYEIDDEFKKNIC